MNTTQTKPEIFFVKSDEIQGRFDPYFYRPEFLEMEKTLKKSKWDIKRIRDIADVKGGKRIPLGKTFSNKATDYPYLRVTDFNENSINTDNLRYISKEVFDQIRNYIISTTDIYISIAGTIGLVGIIPKQLDNKSLTENAGKITNINTEKIDQKYLMYILDSKISKKQINRELLIVGVPKLSLARILNLKIPVPPKEIQNQIVGLMDSAYNFKKQNEQEARKLIEGVDDYVLNELGLKIPKVEDKMTFIVKSIELENNRIDAEFHQEKYQKIKKTLGMGKYKLSKLLDGVEYIKKGVEVGSSAYVESGKTFLRVADFDNFKICKNKLKYISEEIFEENKNCQPQVGEILFSKDGTIGKSLVLDQKISGIISGGIVRIKTKNDLLNNHYLSYILDNKYYKLLLENLSIGQIIKHLLISEFGKIQIPLPPLEIQEKIAKEVKSRLEKAEKLKQEAKENLEQAKQEVEKILLG